MNWFVPVVEKMISHQEMTDEEVKSCAAYFNACSKPSDILDAWCLLARNAVNLFKVHPLICGKVEDMHRGRFGPIPDEYMGFRYKDNNNA